MAKVNVKLFGVYRVDTHISDIEIEAEKLSDLLEELNSAQTLLAAEEPNYLNSLSAKYYSVSVTSRAFS